MSVTKVIRSAREGLADAHLVGFVPTLDLERSGRFYGDVLGLPLIEASPFANVFNANGTQPRVTLVENRPGAPHTVLGWSVADIAATITVLAAAGVEFNRYDGIEQDDQGVWTSPSGARIAWFADPDGNTLSLQQGNDRREAAAQTAGVLSGVYEPNEAERRRDDWPE